VDGHFGGGVSEVRAAKELVVFGDGVASDGVDAMMDCRIDAANDAGFVGVLSGGVRLDLGLSVGEDLRARNQPNAGDYSLNVAREEAYGKVSEAA
jgi:hypothetical protein